MTKADLQQVKQRFGIIGSNSALDHAIDVAVQVAGTDLSVLVTGESGVGKERLPQIIHQNSARKHGPYIAVNCGAIPEGTIDSELFGHEKGAFTGAISDRRGYFEVADGGTIFLDEVGELPLTTQVRLLRVLEVGEFIRVGSSKTQKTNVRVVAATNLDMQKAIAEGRFREDLFYRLSSVPITVPPLRDRGTDVLLLFRKFAVDFAERYRMDSVRLTPEAEIVLQHYTWPGNVRQLKNVAEQISVLSEKREISAEELQNFLPPVSPASDYLPALPGSHSHSNEKSFESDREILYQVLFDMKKDMNDLKKLVHETIANGGVPPRDMSNTSGMSNLFKDQDVSSVIRPQPTVTTSSIKNNAKNIQDTDEYVEEIFSLGDVEKEMIKKALERHNNRRKLAAQDLKISERTLYRKIKEYGLD